jgi:hypothetical protein
MTFFFIWKHGVDKLHEFMGKLNSFNDFFKFTLTFSKSAINFLDVRVLVSETLNLDDSRSLVTEVYRKETNSFAGGLDYSSFHPHHTLHSLPYSLAFRAFKLCSTQEDIDKNLNFIRESFIQRHFPVSLIDSQLNKCADRFAVHVEGSGTVTNTGANTGSDVLTDTVVEDVVDLTVGGVEVSNTLVTPFLTIDYNQFSSTIKSLVLKHFHVVDPGRNIFNLPTISYRRAENFRDKLVSIRRKNTGVGGLAGGQEPCKGARCGLCVQLPSTTNVSFADSSFTWTIRSLVNCNSRNCVYLAVCRLCGLKYVGETVDFRLRMNNHRSQQNWLTASAFYRHRTLTGHCFKDFDLLILRSDLVDKDDMRSWERFFMDRFNTLVPFGLNKLDEL